MIDEKSVSSDELVINAPAKIVWEVLVDFENYHLWNAFCPQIIAELKMGSPVDMMTDMGNGLQRQVEYISQIEPNRAIAWSMENKPGDPVHACRTQWINEIDAASCTYFTVDDFSGEFVPAMLETFGEHIERGFNRCAEGLKLRAEALYNAAKKT